MHPPPQAPQRNSCEAKESQKKGEPSKRAQVSIERARKHQELYTRKQRAFAVRWLCGTGAIHGAVHKVRAQRLRRPLASREMGSRGRQLCPPWTPTTPAHRGRRVRGASRRYLHSLSPKLGTSYQAVWLSADRPRRAGWAHQAQGRRTCVCRACTAHIGAPRMSPRLSHPSGRLMC